MSRSASATATERLSEQLVAAQAAVEQRLADWASDIGKLQESLAEDVKRVETRQQALMAEANAKIGQDADRLQASVEEQRQLVTRLRAEFAQRGAGGDASRRTRSSNSTLPSGATRCTRSPSGCASARRDLKELVEREGNEATQRIQLALGDIERRQVEQLQRIIGRETARYTEVCVCAVRHDDSQRPRGGRAPVEPRARSRGRAIRPRGGGRADRAAEPRQRRGGSPRRGAARPAQGRAGATAGRRA